MLNFIPQEDPGKRMGFLVGVGIVLIFALIGLILYHSDAQNIVLTQGSNEMHTTPPEDHQIVVGIQPGHLENQGLPSELVNLERNTGAIAGGVYEVDINLDIAERVAQRLRKENIRVDILPTTIPADYTADAFIAIHADGSEDPTVRGFKIAHSKWDTTGLAKTLSKTIKQHYLQSTQFPVEPNITDKMREYYAFNYRKFDHAIDASTPGVIVELGFLTNQQDREYLLTKPEVAAQGIADGVLTFFQLSR